MININGTYDCLFTTNALSLPPEVHKNTTTSLKSMVLGFKDLLLINYYFHAVTFCCIYYIYYFLLLPIC
jgi:hypothetical protein